MQIETRQFCQIYRLFNKVAEEHVAEPKIQKNPLKKSGKRKYFKPPKPQKIPSIQSGILDKNPRTKR
jgi:hypothetical protein